MRQLAAAITRSISSGQPDTAIADTGTAADTTTPEAAAAEASQAPGARTGRCPQGATVSEIFEVISRWHSVERQRLLTVLQVRTRVYISHSLQVTGVRCGGDCPTQQQDVKRQSAHHDPKAHAPPAATTISTTSPSHGRTAASPGLAALAEITGSTGPRFGPKPPPSPWADMAAGGGSDSGGAAPPHTILDYAFEGGSFASFVDTLERANGGGKRLAVGGSRLAQFKKKAGV